jgi:hypothetical protein
MFDIIRTSMCKIVSEMSTYYENYQIMWYSRDNRSGIQQQASHLFLANQLVQTGPTYNLDD